MSGLALKNDRETGAGAPDRPAPLSRLSFIERNQPGDPAVVLLHGLGVSGRSWQPQFPALEAAGFRVLAPDLRGFGDSPYPGEMSVGAMAADVGALMRAEGSPRAHVVGISMGGAVAQQLALDAPERVDKLVLVNTFARLWPRRPGRWIYFLWRLILVHTIGVEAQSRAISHRLFPHPDQEALRQQFREQVAQADPRAYRAAMRSLARFNVLDRLTEIERPTLVVTGEDDRTVDPAQQRILAERIPGARQVTIAQAGHGLPAAKPDAFNAVLLGFLTEDGKAS